MAYSPLTDKDISTMLKKIDVSSIEELFKGVPEKFKINFKDFGISEAYSEQDVLSALNSLGGKNLASNISFMGGGAYDHYVQ